MVMICEEIDRANLVYFAYWLCKAISESSLVTLGTFFWGCSSYPYSGLGILENVEFQFLKSGNAIPMAEVT